MPEIDLVAADHSPACALSFAGTIKWRTSSPVTAREIDKLATDSAHIPGFTAALPLMAVCPAGAEPHPSLGSVWTTHDLLAAWP